MKVILLCGKAKHGKSTFGNFLKEELEAKGKKVCTLEYSDYITFYLMKYFGWDGNQEDKPREFMQYLSTDIIRKTIDKDFLVKRTVDDLKILENFFDIAIVGGVREENEIALPKQNFKDCISVKIERKDFDNMLSDKAKKSYTEVALDNYKDYDYTIINDGSLEDLRKKAKDFLEKEVI